MLCEQMLDLSFGREPVIEFVTGGKTALLGTSVSGGGSHPVELLGRKFSPGIPALCHASSLAPCTLHDVCLRCRDRSGPRLRRLTSSNCGLSFHNHLSRNQARSRNAARHLVEKERNAGADAVLGSAVVFDRSFYVLNKHTPPVTGDLDLDQMSGAEK